MEFDLRNKVGIIPGASRGIGAGIANLLAAEGCNLVLAARSSAKLDACAAAARKLGARALAHAADLRAPEAARALVAATLAEFGRIDFLVTNAGGAKMGDFLELGDEDWQDGFALKFFGHMRLIRGAWPHLKASKGSLIVIAGMAGRTPAARSMITGSVNAALMNFTKALAERGTADGIQVNAINPGAIRTGRFVGRLKKAALDWGSTEAEAEWRMVSERGIIRIGEPGDIAALAAFIRSSHGSYLHGALIDVDGGVTKGL